MSSETSGSTALYDALAWLEVNKKRVAIAAVAAVVGGFAIYVYRWKVEQTALAASGALLELRTPFPLPTNAVPVTASSYLKIAETYPGTEAAERALILAAGSTFGENKYAEAGAQFSKFLRERPASPLAATAALGVASCLESEGKRDEAFSAYQGVTTRYPSDGAATQAKLSLARFQEARNQPDQALKTYDEIARANPPSGWSSEASQQRDKLLKKHPQLNKPVVAAPPKKFAPAATPANLPKPSAPNTAKPAAAPAAPVPAAPAPPVPAQPKP